MKFIMLRTAAEIQRKIKWVLGESKDLRIVCVAFVGVNPLKYLPSPGGINLYCWTCVPGTNPYGLKSLMKAGVLVRAVDKLHMKLYWSSSRGAVLGSANLSRQALERGGNAELSVWLPPGTVDARRLAEQLDAREITETELRQMRTDYAIYTRWTKGRKVNTKLREYLKGRIQSDDGVPLRKKGKIFAFTGKCEYGIRAQCEKAVKVSGGQMARRGRVTKETDVLVIGAEGSPNWIWKTHGKKLKKAALLRKQYGTPLIITEGWWRECLGL